ncbi:HypC/HybG/HupF family hydrogenase formation chaperone [Acidothermus cellulolyticus]|uniref:HypC/HybG/HupF family hydrogenase formation chaperone n=1 Tax=Acidothermus cellulolyticus TaxID=28049 RepID=UPI00031EC5CF|nr:HypC/HybG/HupF family hydrogenase formation chaperone [Acidothermus cellulolyticus]
MCLGAIALLRAIEEQDGVRVGILDDGRAVGLSFVPNAQVGDHLLIHLGVPVEVLDAETARAALQLRAEGRRLADRTTIVARQGGSSLRQEEGEES